MLLVRIRGTTRSERCRAQQKPSCSTGVGARTCSPVCVQECTQPIHLVSRRLDVHAAQPLKLNSGAVRLREASEAATTGSRQRGGQLLVGVLPQLPQGAVPQLQYVLRGGRQPPACISCSPPVPLHPMPSAGFTMLALRQLYATDAAAAVSNTQLHVEHAKGMML